MVVVEGDVHPVEDEVVVALPVVLVVVVDVVWFPFTPIPAVVVGIPPVAVVVVVRGVVVPVGDVVVVVAAVVAVAPVVRHQNHHHHNPLQ